MRIQLVTPAPPESLVGNRVTAVRIAGLLRELGHSVAVGETLSGDPTDAVFALHAAKSADAVREATERGLPCALLITGTDVNVEPSGLSPAVEQSLQLATHLVVLHPEGAASLPQRHRAKARVLIQSAVPAERVAHDPEHFDACVIAHLRAVKDPLLAARASREAAADSTLRVRLVGGALEPALRLEAELEVRENPRFVWEGLKSHEETQALLAGSRVLVLSSQSEGGPAAVSEALANGVPVLATRIPALEGLLGRDHPGFYPVGDHRALADLLQRCEFEPEFLELLRQRSVARQGLVAPRREAEDLESLVKELKACTPA